MSYVNTTPATINVTANITVGSQFTGQNIVLSGATNPLLIHSTASSNIFQVSGNGTLQLGSHVPTEEISAYSTTDMDLLLTTDASNANSSLHFQRAGPNAGSSVNGNILGEITFRGYDGVNYIRGAQIIGLSNQVTGSNSIAGALQIKTQQSGTARTAMWIDENQMIGINYSNSTPLAKVHISGGNSAKAFQVDSSGTSLASNFVVLSGGNVGIGTLNPAQPLVVVGNITASGTGVFQINNNTGINFSGTITTLSISGGIIIGAT